jgi:hypothetical protein
MSGPVSLGISSSVGDFAAYSSASADYLTSERKDMNIALSRLYGAKLRTILSVSVTGGGTSFLPIIYSVPGASRCLMDSVVPYARASLRAMLEGAIGRDECFTGAVDSSTALTMARVTQRRAASTFLADCRDLSALRGVRVLGIACTAALATAQPKKGDHRCHIACASSQGIRSYDVVFDKGLRSREEEEELCGRLMLDVLMDSTLDADAEAAGRSSADVQFAFSKHLLTKGDTVNVVDRPASSLSATAAAMPPAKSCPIDNLLAGHTKQVMFLPRDIAALREYVSGGGTEFQADLFDCYEDIALPAGSIVYAGSFRPLHRGHVQLAEAAVDAIPSSGGGRPPQVVVFEISAVNADKPPLSRAEILLRVGSLLASLPALVTPGNESLASTAVCVTRAPLFLDKTDVFRHCTFVLGADTMTRLLNPKYYGDAEVLAAAGHTPENIARSQCMSLAAAMSTMAERGTSFIVGGRHAAEAAGKGDFMTCAQILETDPARVLPARIRGMFSGLPEGVFRADISSTQIRREREMEQTRKTPDK